MMSARRFRARPRILALSTLLTGRTALIIWCACAFIFNWFGLTLAAAFSLLLGLLGFFARLWGRYALHSVEAEVDAANKTLSVGETVNISCRVRNEKFLPLIWLEVCLPVPPRGCLEPDESFILLRGNEAVPEGEQLEKPRYSRRLALLLWYRIAEWESVWTARRRGIYRPGEAGLRAGDGFGLTQSQRQVPIPGEPAFVIYPRLVPVNSSNLLRTVWMGETGARGYLEDPAVLRGVRDYGDGDPWKRIDWRMAARTETLQVKLYETILPRSIHFVLDVASFAPDSAENAELEDMLSVLASLIIRLNEDGVHCGLSLPQTAARDNLDMFPDDPGLGADDILFQMAALEEDGATELFSEHAISAFQHRAGQICFVTRGGGRTTCRALSERLELSALTVLAIFPPSGGEFWAGCRILRTGDIKMEGAV